MGIVFGVVEFLHFQSEISDGSGWLQSTLDITRCIIRSFAFVNILLFRKLSF